MKGPETKLRNKMIEALKEEFPEGLFYHIHGNPFQPAGIPDIVGCLNGRYVGIEVKVPGKDESKIQRYMRRLTLQAQGIAGVAWSVEDCINIARTAILPLTISEGTIVNVDRKNKIITIEPVKQKNPYKPIMD